MTERLKSNTVNINGLNIHYLSAGQGPCIFFIHGFPTSSFLWRSIMQELSSDYRVIAIDLPGYGKSAKRLEDSYSFRYYNEVFTSFLDALHIESVTLAVHDFGGPLGLHWMLQNKERVDRLILFNTLVYPKFSWAVKLFGLATILPGLKNWLTSPNGIKKAIFFGVNQKQKLTDEIIAEYQAPFADYSARKVLLKSVQRLSMKGFAEIEEKLSTFNGPVQIIIGTKDKILPRVAKTMKRVKLDLPQARLAQLSSCGHFLQEDEPIEIAGMVDEFMRQ